MITYSEYESKGRLGNHMFRIASTIGIAKSIGHDFFLPQWSQKEFFKHSFPTGKVDESFQILEEKTFEYHKWNIKEANYDLRGFMQSEKYFDIPLTKKYFTFKENIIQKIQKEFANTLSKKNILISIRRGNFVGSPMFFQISYKYYFLALIKKFPDWKERNIIFTSDDIEYCKYHFSFLKNAKFVSGLHPLEQLALASLCDDFIISNSTFSWWAAWLGEKKDSKIVHPKQFISNRFQKEFNDKDYFPDRWIKFETEGSSIPLKYWKLILRGEIYRAMIYSRRMIVKKTRKIRRIFNI